MFEWEESTFLGLKSLYQRFITKPQQRELEDRQASLSDHRATLVLLARMLSGKNLGIFETEHRTLCAKDRVCLPPQFNEANSPEANTQLYELKTIIASLAMRDEWVGNTFELRNYVNQLYDEFPRLSEKVEWLESQIVDEEDSLWEILGEPVVSTEKLSKDMFSGAVEDLEQASIDVTTEIEGKGQMDVEVLPDPEDDGHGADMPIHTFEKAECLEETSGLSRKTDDEDELEEHAEASLESGTTNVVGESIIFWNLEINYSAWFVTTDLNCIDYVL